MKTDETFGKPYKIQAGVNRATNRPDTENKTGRHSDTDNTKISHTTMSGNSADTESTKVERPKPSTIPNHVKHESENFQTRKHMANAYVSQVRTTQCQPIATRDE